jgi:uncharacterized Tic20 family protein
MTSDFDAGQHSEPSPPDGASPPVEPSPGFPDVPSEDKTMGMLCHLLAFAGYVFPVGNIIGPLIIWLIKKDQSPFVDDQGRESLNFQITVMIAVLICIPLAFVCVGIPLLILIGIAEVILIIIASVNAASGTWYRYPMTIRFIQ